MEPLLAIADPTTLAVYFEDGLAVIGVGVAAASIGISYYTDNVMWDAIGSIVIGILLGIVAVTFIIKNRAYLIGRSIPEEERDEMIAFLTGNPAIERASSISSRACSASACTG